MKGQSFFFFSKSRGKGQTTPFFYFTWTRRLKSLAEKVMDIQDSPRNWDLYGFTRVILHSEVGSFKKGTILPVGSTLMFT